MERTLPIRIRNASTFYTFSKSVRVSSLTQIETSNVRFICCHIYLSNKWNYRINNSSIFWPNFSHRSLMTSFTTSSSSVTIEFIRHKTKQNAQSPLQAARFDLKERNSNRKLKYWLYLCMSVLKVTQKNNKEFWGKRGSKWPYRTTVKSAFEVVTGQWPGSRRNH